MGKPNSLEILPKKLKRLKRFFVRPVMQEEEFGRSFWNSSSLPSFSGWAGRQHALVYNHFEQFIWILIKQEDIMQILLESFSNSSEVYTRYSTKMSFERKEITDFLFRPGFQAAVIPLLAWDRNELSFDECHQKCSPRGISWRLSATISTEKEYYL